MTVAFNEDCMAGMSCYPDGYFDLAICDPPYGIGAGTMAYVRNGNKGVKQKNGKKLLLAPKQYGANDFDASPPGQQFFDELRRVARHQIVWGIDYFDWEGIGPGRIKWDKCVADGLSFSRYETAYCSLIDYVQEFPLLYSGMMQAHTLERPTTPGANKQLNEQRIHPTQKPRLLYKYLFQKFAQPGWRLLDTHLGSGSSRIVADKMGFDLVGFEIDTGYFEAQEQRFINETALPLFA